APARQGPPPSNPHPARPADPASLVITTPDPGDPAWLQLAASSTGAIGQPPATALVVQLPAHPQPTSGRRPGASKAQAPQPQQAHAISTGPSKPASDWLLPGLPRATVVLT